MQATTGTLSTTTGTKLSVGVDQTHKSSTKTTKASTDVTAKPVPPSALSKSVPKASLKPLGVAASKFQPLHQKPANALNVHPLTGSASFVHKSIHKSMFKKQLPSQHLKDKFASPTDSLLSPCSQKLNDHKSKLFKAKLNPTRLNFTTTANAADDSDEDIDDI
ncbi:Bns1p Ecym_2080 [Eremothecium cymbalariae DBVPG|uniref:Uncharacterized protein n=1 Tax=Eremothecium cymbalariae (strain CBS 270.75 / DBVPG 7215 / KCTC 17166 / NRRL Y-17582) TaxID=931890 RepID=G8JPI7_ERECY|nr:Hypothetical protein Ecym_2080 [Eremothecium cymbalariae DBVPG\